MIIDRWGLSLLLAGRSLRARGQPSETDRPAFLIGEREYVRFLKAVHGSEHRPAVLRLLDEIETCIGGNQGLASHLATLLSPEQILDLFSISISIARLPTEAVGLISDLSTKFEIRDSDAETILLALTQKQDFLTCFQSVHPQMWKALYVYHVTKYDIEHQCPRVSTPASWYRPEQPPL